MPRSLLIILVSLSWSCSDTGVKAFNAEPEAAITSHSDGDEVLEGYTESFRGAVSDPDHAADTLTATWYLDGTVICESAAPDSNGISTCEALMTSTASELMLEVQDPGNAAGSDQVTLNVVPTESPEAEITNPTTDGVYYSDQLITFEGVVSDGEDAATDLLVSWESNLDGDLEIETAPNDDGEVIGYSYLTEGEHAVELDVTDTTGKTGTASVIIEVGPPNSTPSCGITAPDDGTAGESGELVTFLATVADVDVAPDWLSVSWSSDKDGEIGSSTPTSAGEVTFPYANLSVNTHVITLSVADEIGDTCTDDIVYSVGTAPEISISSPTSGDVVQESELVSFVATVSDGEDSPTDLSLSWVSDIDGEFSTQGADSTGTILFTESTLSTGTHAITATVTDTDGLYANAIVTLQVNGLPSAPEVLLTPDPADTSDDLVVTITADSVDPDGDPISYSYAWSADGVPSTASTSATLSSTDTAKGQIWTVQVTPNDGYADGPYGSDALTIDNTAPEITSVVIDPDPAYPSDELSCSWGFYDEDDDSDVSTLQWSIDGITMGTDSTLSGVFTAGDVVTCTVTAHDGEESGSSASGTVTIDNTPPEVTEVTLDPSIVFTNDSITASVSTDDAEGDSVSVAYEWYVDGSLVGESGTTLSGVSDFDKDQEVYVVVTPSDDYETGAAVTSDSIIISNMPPEAPEIGILATQIPQISAGGYHTCAIDTAGSVYCWGVDNVGQSSPPSDTFIDVSSAYQHTCGITSDDEILCWGIDDGSVNDHGQVTDVPSGIFTVLSAGHHHNCAIDTAEELHCWGDDSDGQSTPPSGTFVAVAAGYQHSCALDPDGYAECWGDDSYGQSSPPSSRLRSITAGYFHTCGLSFSGEALCWGDDTHGQSTPDTSEFSMLSAGENHTCGLDTVGTVQCWGDNTDGQSSPPTDVFVSVNSGGSYYTYNTSHSCGITDEGLLECWGNDTYGQTTVPTDFGSGALMCIIDVESIDDDSDSIIYTFEWTVDGVAFTDATTTHQTGDTIPWSAIDESQTWACTVTPNDGDDDGDEASDSYTINTPPEAPEISISPAEPVEGEDDLICVIDTDSIDDDGDDVTYTFEWEVDGIVYEDATTTTETGDTVLAEETVGGEEWTCTVTPNDGWDDGDSNSIDVIIEDACREGELADGYEINHTGGDCDEQRWGHPYFGDVSGDYDVIPNVSSEEDCAALCSSETSFVCAGFMYKSNGTYSSDGPGSWEDEACTLLENLESNPTSVTSLVSATML